MSGAQAVEKMETGISENGRVDRKVMRRWKCRSCGDVSRETELLLAPSPFDDTDTLTGCPSCKGCSDGFDLLCDEDGCMQEAHLGWPTGDKADKFGGYRNTCGKHREADKHG